MNRAPLFRIIQDFHQSMRNMAINQAPRTKITCYLSHCSFLEPHSLDKFIEKLKIQAQKL